jgi:hypothetical protein
MKVRELIAELQKCDAEAPVWAHVYIDDSGQPLVGGSTGVSHVTVDNPKRPIVNVAVVVA